MKVMFRAHSPCIRTYKEAKALRSLGVKVALLYDGKTVSSRYPGLRDEDAFDEAYLAGEVGTQYGALYHFIEDQGIEVIHTAHPPDWTVRDLQGCGVPVVHDFHDLYSLESVNPMHLRTEKDATRWASGLVYVSDMMEQYMIDRYPNAVSMSRVIGNAADDHPVTKRPKEWPLDEIHLVYAAAMPRWDEPHFRDLKGLVAQLKPQGVHLHVQAVIVVPGIAQEASVNPLVHVEPPRTGRDMIESMTRYDAAVWYCRQDVPEDMLVRMNMCLPNKLYEYWQAGLPILCKGGKTPKEFVEEYQIGWVVDNFSNIQEMLRQPYEPLRPVITMKEEAEGLVELYEEVLWR